MKNQDVDTRLIEHKNGVSFLECLEQCLHSDMLAQWERLSGKKLLAANGLERMIDKATGYDMVVMREFADFVYAYVFTTFKEEK